MRELVSALQASDLVLLASSWRDNYCAQRIAAHKLRSNCSNGSQRKCNDVDRRTN